jgi:hypothetical protein
MNTRQLSMRLALIVILFAVAFGTKQLILHGVDQTKLHSAPALAGLIAPSLLSNKSKNLPVNGKDFTILSSQYFENKQWVVVSVESKQNKSTAFLVIEKINDVYTVVLGPGTFFPNDVTQSMPADVASYLVNKGLVH